MKARWSNSSCCWRQNNHLDDCSVAVTSRRRQWEWGGAKCKLWSGQQIS